MIQVNLIPDLKAEFLKAQRNKRFVMSIAMIIAAAFIGLVVLLFIFVNVAQRKHTSDLNKDIQSLLAEYQQTQDIDKIVTIQKQLEALPALHGQKPLISRVVTYLSVVTPENVEFRSFDINFDNTQIIIAGSAKEVPDVNQFANTIKNAIYTVGDDTETQLTPFSNVILNRITSDDEGAQFDIQFLFDPEIFSNHGKVVLKIPKIDSTISEIESPSATKPEPREGDLFDGDTEEETQ